MSFDGTPFSHVQPHLSQMQDTEGQYAMFRSHETLSSRSIYMLLHCFHHNHLPWLLCLRISSGHFHTCNEISPLLWATGRLAGIKLISLLGCFTMVHYYQPLLFTSKSSNEDHDFTTINIYQSINHYSPTMNHWLQNFLWHMIKAIVSLWGLGTGNTWHSVVFKLKRYSAALPFHDKRQWSVLVNNNSCSLIAANDEGFRGKCQLWSLEKLQHHD